MLMKEYSLYLESGPKHKTTMVHVLNLLGCIARGPTTEEAIEAAPSAIRKWLDFLMRHGEAAHPEGEFSIRVVEHVTEGVWLGYGDPTPGFGPDFDPLTPADQKIYIRHLGWLQAALLDFIRDLPLEKILEEPESGGRSILQILQHVTDSEVVYLRYLVGKVPPVSDAMKTVSKGPVEFLIPNLMDLWTSFQARLELFSDDDRQKQVPHGQVIWTARRAFRRMLEHAWEHVCEISDRLKIPG